ncbi:MAG: HAD family hydrolase [Elusimicrobiota bacterium]
MKQIDAIIFDLDGTLADSKDNIVDSVNQTLKEMALPEKPHDEIASCIGSGVRELIAGALGKENRHLLDTALNIYSQKFSGKNKLYPHAGEILKHFQKKLIFLLTNREKEKALITLKEHGIENYFKEVMGGDNERCLKPAGCALDGVFKWTNKRERIVIVGDMDLDIKTGKKAGIITCAVTHGIGKEEDIRNSNPDYIISDLIELKKIFN